MSLSVSRVKLSTLIVLLCTFCLTPTSNYSQSFIKGADGSVLDQVEQSGGFFLEGGVEKDAYQIFKNNGITTIRLKLWHTPAEPYNDLSRVMVMAKRIKDLGLGFTLDFHYSDTWADPAHQTKPSAWDDLTFDVLADSIYRYTKYVITQLKSQNTLPDYVQIGNEINCGLLWNDGNVCNPDSPEQWNKLGILIKNARLGLEEAIDPGDEVKIILHLADGGNNGVCRWWYDNILEEGVRFDVIGLSFYPWWHGNLSDLKNNLNDLANRYNKDIIIVEAAYPWTLSWNDNTNNIIGSANQLLTGYPATVDGQYRYLRDLMEIIKSTTNGKGKGIMYWSPEWISAPQWGSPWENLALFDFDNEVLSSIKAFDDNTGINDFSSSKIRLGIKPNPATSNATISFTLDEKSFAKIELHLLSGKKLYTIADGNFGQGLIEIPLNLDNLTPGIYLLSLTVNEVNYYQKIIKTE
jgi:arabinogalactan endo-1,4-beta-galactosidase